MCKKFQCVEFLEFRTIFIVSTYSTIISGSLGSYLLYRFGWRCVFYTTGRVFVSLDVPVPNQTKLSHIYLSIFNFVLNRKLWYGVGFVSTVLFNIQAKTEGRHVVIPARSYTNTEWFIQKGTSSVVDFI